MHRDIKPENIIFETEEDTSGMQLIDFGFAASGVVGQSLTTACGTPQYAAPEILNGVPHGKEVDCWSLGVVTYVLLCGFPPFYHEDEQVSHSVNGQIARYSALPQILTRTVTRTFMPRLRCCLGRSSRVVSSFRRRTGTPSPRAQRTSSASSLWSIRRNG